MTFIFSIINLQGFFCPFPNLPDHTFALVLLPNLLVLNTLWRCRRNKKKTKKKRTSGSGSIVAISTLCSFPIFSFLFPFLPPHSGGRGNDMIYRFSSSFFCLFLASSFLNVESFTVASFPSFFFFLILAADSPLADDSRGTFRHFVRVFHFICFVFFLFVSGFGFGFGSFSFCKCNR